MLCTATTTAPELALIRKTRGGAREAHTGGFPKGKGHDAPAVRLFGKTLEKYLK